jgi:hypothetical protein
MIDGERGSAEPDVLPAPGARLMPSTRRQSSLRNSDRQPTAPVARLPTGPGCATDLRE